MISLDKAIELVINSVCMTDRLEQVSLSQGINRILARDVASDINMPPFRKTAVDGYACRMQDIANPLVVLEVIAAGNLPTKPITEGTCSKIMTGAPIPAGADCVIPVEDTKILTDGKILFTATNPKSNICEIGEDIKIGESPVTKGTHIKPQHIAIMAALGCHKPMVASQPKVSILPTGDELVEPTEVPHVGQIRNSNGHQLIAQVSACGAIPIYQGIVRDTEAETENALKAALNESDMVILTGGVSMGDFDHVPAIMERLGIKILFDSIAVQPGKPTTFGVTNNKLIFGLPGNPVSSFIQFELLVKPAILKMMGCSNPFPPIYRLPLATQYTRKHAERMGFFPVQITPEGQVMPIEFHGSAHIFALANANAIASIALGVKELNKGDLVDVRPI